MLQSGVEEKIGLVWESDIFFFISLDFEDAKVDNGRRVDRAAVSGR